MTKSALLILLIGISSSLCFAGVQDSVGVEKKNGKVYVLHKVEPKETLFGLSRKYNVSVDEIKKENPEMVASGLQIGQLVSIPRGVYMAPAARVPVTHTVAAKETLFAISKKYNISIEDIKNANPGLSKDIKIGQELVIPAPAGTADAKDYREIPADLKKEDVQKRVENEKPVDRKSPLPVYKAGVKVTETGVAEMIEDESEKYLALHKAAPVGTIIQVVNEANGQMIFVRVIGRLPETGANEKTLIKISKRAFEKLSPTDKKLRVELSFIP